MGEALRKDRGEQSLRKDRNGETLWKNRHGESLRKDRDVTKSELRFLYRRFVECIGCYLKSRNLIISIFSQGSRAL